MKLVLPFPEPKISGTGEVKQPPDALERVRAELGRTVDPARRAEIEAVLRELEGKKCN